MRVCGCVWYSGRESLCVVHLRSHQSHQLSLRCNFILDRILEIVSTNDLLLVVGCFCFFCFFCLSFYLNKETFSPSWNKMTVHNLIKVFRLINVCHFCAVMLPYLKCCSVAMWNCAACYAHHDINTNTPFNGIHDARCFLLAWISDSFARRARALTSDACIFSNELFHPCDSTNLLSKMLLILFEYVV